jgi:hypothetical protein
MPAVKMLRLTLGKGALTKVCINWTPRECYSSDISHIAKKGAFHDARNVPKTFSDAHRQSYPARAPQARLHETRPMLKAKIRPP